MYPFPGCPDSTGYLEEDDGDDYENATPPYKDLPPKPGYVEEDDRDDYENSTPPYKDLPPKPGWLAPPRPPRTEKQAEKPRLPCKAPRTAGPDLPPVTRASPQPGVHLEPLPPQRSLAVTGMAGLAGLKKDIDRARADTNQSLAELRGLLDGRSRVTCPEGWLHFEGKCYYFSPDTKSWEEARKFCQENYSHLVIVSSFAEQNFVAKANGFPRVYWLGLHDRNKEGDWRWLDGSPVTLSFWDPEEPNNMNEEDCASMNRGGGWNDLSCEKTTYWICERKCSC
nr:C-type lectin domain family 17, member A isoform X3 [Microcebus murinus]